MVSNNVWVEASVHPDSAKLLDLGWPGIQETASKLHVTMAFTNLNADQQHFDNIESLRNRLMTAVVDLPELAEYDGFDISGAAILQPGKGNFGVLLLSSQILWSYHTAFARELTKGNELDLTYPGWLPHITLCEDVSNRGDQECIIRVAENVPSIKLDGLWLRAGRICVPL